MHGNVAGNNALSSIYLYFFSFQDLLYFKVYCVLVYIRRPSGGESLGLNRLSGEGVDLVADWGPNTG